MKKILCILLAGLMLLSLAACGDNNSTDPDKENPGTSQSGENNNNSNIKISTATIDGYDLPDVALAYVGTLNKAYNDYHRDAEAHFYVKSKDADDDAFDALVAYYASNGGTLDEEESTSTSKCFDFEWGRIEAAHFGADEEISVFIVVPQYPIDGDEGEENNSGTTEPDNTGNNSSENSDAEISTVEDFFAFYGFNAEDIKPNHFTSFEELEMVGSVKIGKQGSKGIVKFNVEKGKTTADDYNAWFEALHAEMTSLSEDGKLWYTAGTAKEAMTVEELKAEAWWDNSPYSTCYITTNANGKATRINISYSYDVDAEQYKIIILVHGPG